MPTYEDSPFHIVHSLKGGGTARHQARFVRSVNPEGYLDVMVGTATLAEQRFAYSNEDGTSMISAYSAEQLAIIEEIRQIFGIPSGPSSFFFELEPDNADQVAMSKFNRP